MHCSQEDGHMDSMDNVRERFEALAQQMERLTHQPHTFARQARWWRRLTGGRLVLSLLSLTLPWGRPAAASAATVVNPLCPGEFVSFNPGQGEDIVVPAGFTVSVFASGLNAPTPGLPFSAMRTRSTCTCWNPGTACPASATTSPRSEGVSKVLIPG
jgi:hypothetical protein